MPHVRTSSELQRNIGAIYDLCHETREPVYITHHGKEELVIMDADAFDRTMAARDELREREMAVYSNLMRGYGEYQVGHSQSATSAFEAIRSQKGWA